MLAAINASPQCNNGATVNASVLIANSGGSFLVSFLRFSVELFVCIGGTHFVVFLALMGITACAKYPTFCFYFQTVSKSFQYKQGLKLLSSK